MDKIFIHTAKKVRILAGAQEFSCTTAEFLALEPDYAGEPELYWSDGLKIPVDAPDCSVFCDKISTYTVEMPVLPVYVGLSKTILNADDPNDVIVFSATLGNPPYPIEQSWIIRLRDEDGLVVDAFPVEFVAGSVEKNYVYHQGLEFGVVRLDQKDFQPVEMGGQAYQPVLINPVEFTIYRTL